MVNKAQSSICPWKYIFDPNFDFFAENLGAIADEQSEIYRQDIS